MSKSSIGVLCLAAFALVGAGCSMGQFPDPNDPKDVAPTEVASVLHRNLQVAADELDRRVQTGEISDHKRLGMLSDLAQKDLANSDYAHTAPADAWIYADMMITAGRFSEAIPLLQTAIKWATDAKNDDRRVNDSFRLARCYAETGKVDDALHEAQAVIDTHPGDPGPVLPSVLLQITPAARGKGHDPELAKILEESIHEHLQMKVDPTSVPGKAFLIARPILIQKAWRAIEELYVSSGHQAEATAAEKREMDMMRAFEKGQPKMM